MAELIDRSFTAQMLRRYAEQKHFSGETELANGILKAMCFIEKQENIPTTTEAEIRAKAYEEFMDEIIAFC